MTQAAVAAKVMERRAEGDPKMTRGTVAKIETGERAVSIDELFELAVALSVPPTLLLVPLGIEDEMAVTATITTSPGAVLDWMLGDAPLGTPRGYIDTAAWRAAAQPIQLWQPLNRLYMDHSKARSLVTHWEYVGDDDQARAARGKIADALRNLHAHLLRIADAGLRMPRTNPDVIDQMRVIGLDVSRIRPWTDEQQEDFLDYARESYDRHEGSTIDEYAHWRAGEQRLRDGLAADTGGGEE